MLAASGITERSSWPNTTSGGALYVGQTGLHFGSVAVGIAGRSDGGGGNQHQYIDGFGVRQSVLQRGVGAVGYSHQPVPFPGCRD